MRNPINSTVMSYLVDPKITLTEIQEIIKNHDTNIRVLLNDFSELSMKEGLTHALNEGIKGESSTFFTDFEDFI